MAKDPVHAQPDGGSAKVPISDTRSIFRSEALHHYRESQDRIAFPRLATPRALAYLWILAVLFILLGFAVASRALLPLG